MPDVASVARGVYTPRRPQASPLFRLVSDDLQRRQTVYDERFAPPDTLLGKPPPRTAHTGRCLTLTAVHPSTPRSCRSR